MKTNTILVAATAVSLALAGGAAAGEAVIKGGAPCGDAASCYVFGSDGPPPVLATLKFKAKRAGTLAVTVNGSMNCVNVSVNTSTDRGVYDLATQIAPADGSPPVYAEAGGARYAARLPRSETDGLGRRADFSNAFNLTATRIFEVAPGKTEYAYKMQSLRIDPLVTCTIFTLSMYAAYVD